jgi:hypothetical protein
MLLSVCNPDIYVTWSLASQYICLRNVSSADEASEWSERVIFRLFGKWLGDGVMKSI